jgi:hypothetical protein
MISERWTVMTTRTRPVRALLALVVCLATAPHVATQAAHASGPAGSAPATHAAGNLPVLHVRVTATGHRVAADPARIRPGNTVFDLTTAGPGHAAVQLLRLRPHYTFSQLRSDLGKDSVQAVRRIDRGVVFYGGMPATRDQPAHFGVRVEAGRYFLLDFDTPRWTRLRVAGDPQLRSLPGTTGSVDMVLRNGEHRFSTPRRLPHSGWLRQSNHTDEPHFMDMTRIKSSTTRRQVRRALAGKGPEDPGWVLHEYPGTFVVSPGRTVVWRYDYPAGKYLELCFWPSDEDGTPHALMGMWNLTTLQ